jgi:hypothetical protein
VKAGHELSEYRVGRRKMIIKEEIDQWKVKRDKRIIELGRSDYLICLEFALRSFYAYRSTTDFGTPTQRDAGKFVSNFVSGKLGEIAVQKFLYETFKMDIKLDFDIRDAVVGQDITEIAKPRKGPKVYNPPRIRISIKTTKFKNIWLVVPANELDDKIRSSDIYILTRVDLPLDHFFRLLKEHSALSNLDTIIPNFSAISSEVVGFVTKAELSSKSAVTQLPKPKQDIGLSYIWRSGEVIKSTAEWNALISKL